MPGHASQFDIEPVAAVYRSDDTGREAFGFEDGPLLDVQFGVGQNILRSPRNRRNLRRVEAEIAQRVAHHHAVRIDLVEQRRIERARHGATAEKCRTKAHALLVAKSDDFDRKGRARGRGVQRAHAFDRGDHTQHAVVLARVAHRIQMRPQHQARKARALAFVAAHAVAYGVEPCVHPGFAHPAQNEFVHLALLGGEENARQSALQFGQAAERVAAVPDALRLQGGNDLWIGGHVGRFAKPSGF